MGRCPPAADLFDELAGGLGDAIDRLGIEEIEQNLCEPFSGSTVRIHRVDTSERRWGRGTVADGC